MRYDTIVIGAGLAGLIGGLRLAEAGRRVLLLAKGQGATHWAAGTIDILAGERPREALSTLLSERPTHPYAQGGLAALEAGLARLRAICSAAGYPLVGTIERNVRLPTASGALRPTALLPATMAAGDARLAGPVLVAGFPELRDFFPALIAANLRAQGVDARPCWLELPLAQRRATLAPTWLAGALEQPAALERLGRQLRAARGDARRVALPAVLGMARAAQTVAALQEHAGAQIFEVATLPPSIPGMRLYALLSDAFRRAGGRIQIGAWVVGAEREGCAVRAVLSEASARSQRHEARSFLLATGGIAGGGLRAGPGGEVVETALGLPVVAPHADALRVSSRFLASHGHPIYRAGISVDERLRPLLEPGDQPLENVAVAGAALGGADLIRERCYEGVAIATGWRAAEVLDEYLARA